MIIEVLIRSLEDRSWVRANRIREDRDFRTVPRAGERLLLRGHEGLFIVDQVIHDQARDIIYVMARRDLLAEVFEDELLKAIDFIK